MSTRGIIARKTESGWEGVYHHWDSYPEGLGKEIWDLIHGEFKNDVHSFLKFAIDDHPAGWSHIFAGHIITDNDLSKKPDELEIGKQCYCHGFFAERDEIKPEEVELIKYPDCIKDPQERQTNCLFWEWIYIIDPSSNRMKIWCSRSTGKPFIVKGTDRMGMEYTYKSEEYKWFYVATVRFDREEPDWKKIEAAAHKPAKKIKARISGQAKKYWRLLE